jgi:hypothetical protein
MVHIRYILLFTNFSKLQKYLHFGINKDNHPEDNYR